MEGSRGGQTGHRLLQTLGVVSTTGVIALILHAHRLLGDLVSSNNDLRVHYRWAVAFVAGVHRGDSYPRWIALANQGLGEPALLFYSPLYYYATALVAFFTRDTWTAMKLVEFAGIWATGLFAYGAMRRFCPPGWSIAGAVVVQAAPTTRHWRRRWPWWSGRTRSPD